MSQKLRTCMLLFILVGVVLAGSGLAQTRMAVASMPLAGTRATTAPVVIDPDNLSAGDPYSPELGNAGYDAQHYTVQVRLDPDREYIDGRVTMEAKSTKSNLRQVSLDLVGFEVSQVTVGNRPARFSRQNKKLIIDLPRPLRKGAHFSLTVAYRGDILREQSEYVPFIPYLGVFYPSREDTIFVVSEPDGTRYWYPVNDHPRDKATYRFEVIVPAGLEAIANGRLVRARHGIPHAFPDSRDGSLFVWQHNHPLASAFVTIIVGQYETIENKSGRVPIRHYVFPERREEWEAATQNVDEMMVWMTELFGPYPFEVFGYATVADLGTALETQTVVIIDEGIHDENTLLHELVHMWFGNSVSVDSWGEIWRSEGFATYIPLMWETRGDPAALERKMAELQRIVEERNSPYPLNKPPRAAMFAEDSYQKGALLVHDLRKTMGDRAFFAGLHRYFRLYRGGTASDAEFQAVLEEAAGFSLQAVFDKWFSVGK